MSQAIPTVSPELYINRELSWINFNYRVLAQALDEHTPLLEQAKFSAIFSNNLDEFFMVRVASLKSQQEAGVATLSDDGRTALEQLEAIQAKLRPLLDLQQQHYRHSLKNQLAEYGALLIDYANLNNQQRQWVDDTFRSAIFPVLNPPLIEAFGWRQAFTYNAVMPLVLLVLVALAVKGTPAQAGYRAVGQSAALADLKQHGLTFREALRTRSFWAIAVSGFLAYYAIFSFVQHFVLHLNKGFGFALADAGKMMFLFSLVAMTAKFGVGWLADHIDRHKVFTACQFVMLAGMIGLASMQREWVVASAVVIGLGWGGLFTLYNMLAVNNFGLREIGRINGTISLMESVGVGLGSWVTGLLFDRFGSYQVPFTVLAAAIAVALLVGTQIRSEVDERVVAAR